jgi:hypothetical protein
MYLKYINCLKKKDVKYLSVMAEYFGQNSKIWDKFHLCRKHNAFREITQG